MQLLPGRLVFCARGWKTINEEGLRAARTVNYAKSCIWCELMLMWKVLSSIYIWHEKSNTGCGDLYFKERPQLESHTHGNINSLIEIMGRFHLLLHACQTNRQRTTLGCCVCVCALCVAVSLPPPRREKWQIIRAPILTRTQQHTARMRFRVCILGEMDGVIYWLASMHRGCLRQITLFTNTHAE